MSEFRRWALGLAAAVLGLLTVWLLVSYLLLPEWWRVHSSRHPVLTNGPRITTTAAGIAGDPINVSIIGSENDLLAAGWYPADPITVKSSLRIAQSTIFHRPYDEAPVSNLFLFGRREDLAFEKPVGNDVRQRHHIRFWRVLAQDALGDPYWVGAITFDGGDLWKTDGRLPVITLTSSGSPPASPNGK
jgi:LssY-like putative type I secretion system component LssY